jgi:hypothetical protein
MGTARNNAPTMGLGVLKCVLNFFVGVTGSCHPWLQSLRERILVVNRQLEMRRIRFQQAYGSQKLNVKVAHSI